jgi:hypothetical protein
LIACVIELEVAGVPAVCEKLEVKTQVIISPLFNVEEV